MQKLHKQFKNALSRIEIRGEKLDRAVRSPFRDPRPSRKG